MSSGGGSEPELNLVGPDDSSLLRLENQNSRLQRLNQELDKKLKDQDKQQSLQVDRMEK